MSESERRRKYHYDRVLIETARVLSSTFDDAVVFLSGAQLEMLRNVTQYLRRIETYVTEYNPGYYLAPTPADYDDILVIVADLEETLMGNPNTIWGYEDRLSEGTGFDASGAGDKTVTLLTVPAGYVYLLNLVNSRNADKVVNHQHLLYDGSLGYDVALFASQPANVWAVYDKLYLPLKAGDVYQVRFEGCDDGDTLRARAWGYKMKVPT